MNRQYWNTPLHQRLIALQSTEEILRKFRKSVAMCVVYNQEYIDAAIRLRQEREKVSEGENE